MSDEGETCPLCAEEMDLTDQQLKPCKCGYEVLNPFFFSGIMWVFGIHWKLYASPYLHNMTKYCSGASFPPLFCWHLSFAFLCFNILVYLRTWDY